MMIHKGEKPFECNICNKKFRVKSNYNFHMKSHIPKDETILKYNCDGINNKSKNVNDIFCIQLFKDNRKSKDNNDIHKNDNILNNNEYSENNDYKKNDTIISTKYNLNTYNNEFNINNNIISINEINSLAQDNKDFDNDFNSLVKIFEENITVNNYNNINNNEKNNIFKNEYETLNNFNLIKENCILYEQKKELDDFYHYEQSYFNYIKSLI